MKTLLIIFPFLCILQSTIGGQDLEFSTPDEQGISEKRLGVMHQYVEGIVEDYPLTGAVTLVARNGKIVDTKAFGYRDKILGIPMEEDSIFRIHSMTKLVTSVAALILMEEGKFLLTDPIENLLPEFKDPEIFVAKNDDGIFTKPAKNKITILHLLTHTAGFPRGRFTKHEIDKLYKASRFHESKDLDELAKKLGDLPLQFEPGERWHYGTSTEVLTTLIQRAAGVPFDQFVMDRIILPLKMNDTFFVVPENKRDRLVSVFNQVDGELQYVVPRDENGGMRRPYPSGSGGLYSTVTDYYKFAQMLLNGGHYNGVSILGKKTVELMMTNALGFTITGRRSEGSAEGFGLGGAVKMEHTVHNRITSIGTFGWGGAATTWFRIDPQEEFIAMFFTQQYRMASELIPYFANTAWQSIIE